jgi:hypothetical protein
MHKQPELKLVVMRTRKNLLTFLSLFIYIQLFSQSLFQKTFGPGEGKELIKTLDNNLIIVGTLDDYTVCNKFESVDNYHFWLTKIDSNGMIIKKSDNFHGYPILINETKNNEFNFITKNASCLSVIPEYFFSKIDSGGKILFDKYLPIGYSPYTACINNNKYFLMSYWGLLFSVNQNGDTLYSKTYELGVGAAILQIDNANILSDDFNTNYSSSLIMKIDSVGKIIWEKEFNKEGYLHINKDFSNNLLISGSYQDTFINSQAYYNASIMYINSQGDSLISKVFQSSYNWKFSEIIQIKANMFVAVQISDKNSLVFLDNNFNILSSTVLENLKTFSKITKIDSNLYILGTTKNSEILLIKTDFNGEITPIITNNILQCVNYDLLIYPNPSKNYISVKSQNGINSVCIYNYIGAIIYTKNDINSNEIKINISAYKSGLYLVKFRLEDKSVLIKKIIKE